MVTLTAKHIQLHHALGLGPMWVARSARIITHQQTSPAAILALSVDTAQQQLQPREPLPATPTVNGSTIRSHPSRSTTATDTDTPSEAATPQSVEHKVSKRAAALLAHIAQSQHQARPQTITDTSVQAMAYTTAEDYQDQDIHELAQLIHACQRCDLHDARRQAFAAQALADCRLIVVLPHPSLEDDAAAELLSGEIGEMWGKMIHAMHLSPDQVYVTCAIKCAPNLTLVPQQIHAASCSGYLQRELQLLPEVPVLLLAQNQISLFQRLQQWTSTERVYRIPHPSKMLRNPATKKTAWATLQQLMQHL